ncbi:MAG: PaeR7I family type II restriction endonuclease [Bacteroidia bacterium]|nr:PaeR7I family type II restriction endonuclease [Bacteroidia bacterium]
MWFAPLQEPHFKVRLEFLRTSYLDRYVLFCKKLMQERQYTSTALISTTEKSDFEYPDNEISFDSFLLSFMGFIQGKLKDFEK